jgi:lipopolysaccharide transport system ATP-binding protein
MRKAEVDRSFDEIVQFAEVERFIDTPVKRYSSGMYVRLAFAVAAHLEPEILIIDEVLAVGDAAFQNKCLGKMQHVSSDGRTVLFVSHNMAAVADICPTSLLLVDGELAASGPTQDVIRNYLADLASNSAEARLDNLPSRSGTGEFRFDWVKIENARREPCQTFQIGSTFKLSFGLRNMAGSHGVQPTCGIQIRNSNGVSVCNISNWDSNFAIPSLDEVVSLSLTIQDLRLYPDRYHVSLWVGSRQGHDTYDVVVDCLTFDVIQGGPMVTRPLLTHDGLLFVTPVWECRKTAADVALKSA